MKELLRGVSGCRVLAAGCSCEWLSPGRAVEQEQDAETVLGVIEEHIGVAWLEEAAWGWDNPGW